MKYVFICGKKVFLTDEDYKEYQSNQNHEDYIFGRKQWRAGVVSLEVLPFDPASSSGADDDFEKKEMSALIWKALSELNELNPEYFKIINLLIFELHKPKEVAKQLGISQRSVYYKRDKALKILRQLLEKEM